MLADYAPSHRRMIDMPRLIRPSLAFALTLPGTLALAQTSPVVGDRGVAIADAPVPRPAGTPCVAELYTDVAFDDHGEATSREAKPREWTYTPNAQCAGPWSKVVLEADFSVTAGRQYDRTVSLWLKGVNLFYGTTQEPGAKVSPHWHVERDVSDYASLFRDTAHGQTILNNWVDATRNGVIKGSARLVFYPASAHDHAAAPADLAIGLVGDRDGHPVDVQNEHETLSRTLTLPRNVERVALDLIAQSQAVDEQWYMCIDDADMQPTRDFSLGPPNAGDPLEQCPGGNFREVAVSIDGQPAGRAPVYPWTYTGGVDPNLWRPTTDIQTLNFTPYRVELTPFAALLDDGKPHTVAVRVLGAHDFFSLAANLLAWRDGGREVLTGKLTQNTLADQDNPPPRVQRDFKHGPDGTLQGEVDTLQSGHYVIVGELQTSHGKVVTRVEQHADFDNRQGFDHSATDSYKQRIAMHTHVVDELRRTIDAGVTQTTHQLDYPLLIDIHKTVHAGGDFTADITMQQGYLSKLQHMEDGHASFWSTLDNHLTSHSNTDFNAGGTGITGSRGQHGQQSYRYNDSSGRCYARQVETRDQAVVAVESGEGCPSHG
jgi:hypothetical protein